MEKVIHNLKEKSILHRDQVMNIKKYINEKYKGEEASRKAAIFADAVHNIVDLSVKKFEKEHRLQIRSEVLKSAIAKDIFDISGYDVFEVCSLLPIDHDSQSVKEKFFANLTEWINENQEEEVTLDEAKAMSAQIIDAAVFEVVNLLEESVLIDREIKEIGHRHQPEVIEDSPDLASTYNDNPDLEAHITDGRFMNVEGDIVELSISDIEKAIKDSQHIYGDLDDIEVEERIDKKIIRDEINKRISIEQEDDIAKQVLDSITVQVGEEEEEVFDSMDFFNDSEDEEEDDSQWTDAKVVRESKIEASRLGGYELKPPSVGEANTGVTFKVKLIIIIPAIIVTLALIIFLIVGALSVSKKNASLEEQIKHLQDAASSSVILVSETVPSDIVSIETSQNHVMVFEGVNYSEGAHLAGILKYKPINPDLLKEYLENKNSILSEDYYIDVFIQVAKDYNVNPLLLVAITGQEQAFVPKDHPDVELMKNNPFNVYISWKQYNTNFEDACKIAARTILTSSEHRPAEEDPIKWINDHKYAEDENWHIGVSHFFNELTVMIHP